MRRPRRNHSAKFKSKVALAALKGDKAMAELTVQFDVHTDPSVKDLQARIGQLTMENDFLKKLYSISGIITRQRSSMARLLV